MARVILIEASPFSPATGALVPVRLAGGGSRPFNHRGYNDWRDCIVAEPMFTASIELSDAGWTGRSVPSAAAITVQGGANDLVDDLMQLVWNGARLTMYSGDDAVADPVWTIETKGNVADLMVRDGQMQIIMSDLSGDLGLALASDTFAGTGGLEGGTEAEGRTKRRSWGRVYNVEGRVLDKANNIYEFGDTYRPIQAFVSVKDRGRTGPINYVGWAGSAAATLAALQAASVPGGGAAVAASIACVKWWTQPAGPLTADLLGEIGGGYVETVAQIAQQIVAGVAPTITFAGLAAATAMRPDPAGIHLPDSSTTAALALDQLLVQASLLWVLSPAGDIQLLPIGYDDPVETIVADQVERVASLSPVATFAIGYQHNEHVHSDGGISAALLGTDLVFADGRTGDALAAQLDDVQALADASASDIEAAADDGVLSRKEKSSVIVPRDDTLEKAWEFLDGRAATLSGFASVAAARSVASDARTAWRVFRDAISPAWNNYDLDSAVNRVLLVGRLNDWDYSLDQLADAIRRAVAVNNVNLIAFSGFEQGLRGWGAFVSGGTQTAGYPITGTYLGKSFIKQIGEAFSGPSRFIYITQDLAYKFPVQAGQRYAVQARIESQSIGGTVANNYLRCQWLDSNGAYITEHDVRASISGPQVYGTLMAGFVTAPVGAISGRLIFYVDTGTTGQIEMAMYEPMVSSATADQTEFPTYTTGRQDGAQGIPGNDGISPYMFVLNTNSVGIQATYSGATKSGQVPRYVTASIKQGTGDITGSASFTVTPSSSAIVATYSAGTVTISQADASGYIDVTATIGATTIGTLRIQITRQLDPAPPASQSSGSALIGGSFSNSSYPGIYGNSTILAANGSGQLICNGGGEYDVSGGASTMSMRAGACFGYRPAGSSTWSYTAEVVGSTAINKATEDQSPGAVEVGQTIGGLTAGGFYEVILMIRRYTGSSGAIGFFAGQYSVSQ